MTTYMIHTCPDRLWYVENYLVPSLLARGIRQNQIIIHNDDKCMGALHSFVKSAKYATTEGEGIWHLQDDVVVCKDFKELTEKYDDGIVCGIATEFDRERKGWYGDVTLHQMWYSFPCIRIPNDILNAFAEWFVKYVQNNVIYTQIVHSKKHDDMMFRMYLESTYKEDDLKITNLNPNLVEHVDWLIGGSVTNKARGKKVMALYFNEPELVEELKECLKKENP